MRKIDAIDGVIDENKKEELKSEYPGFYLLNDLIKNHNKKFNKNDSKMNYSNENNIKKNYSGKNNIKKDYSKPFEEFKTKLKGINHIIYGDEITELNPKNFSYYNRLIKIHNTKLINNEKLKISKEFNSELKKYNTIIDEEEIEKLKAKYTKDYYDFFTEMDMEKSINNYNKNLEKKQMVEVFSILRQKYSSLNSPISEKIVSDLILKYPSMDWDKLIKKYNKQYFNNKYKKTDDNVFYLNDYIRKDDWDFVDLKRAEISKEILKYKDGVLKFVNKFTDEIIEFIEDFSNYGVDDNIEKIFLVSIPSSTPERNKRSSMKKSIKIIENKYEEGLINNSTKELINFSNSLIRIGDVKIAHINPNDRPKYEDHIRTIVFSNEKGYAFKNSVFLILDDITTTGTIMNACGNILLNNNIEKNKIYKLAIAATAWDYNE